MSDDPMPTDRPENDPMPAGPWRAAGVLRIPYSLTGMDLADAGVRLAAVLGTTTTTEARHKAARARQQAELEGLRRSRDDLAEQIRTGHGYQEVKLVERWNIGAATAERYREDTWAKVGDRSLTDDEVKRAQLDLFATMQESAPFPCYVCGKTMPEDKAVWVDLGDVGRVQVHEGACEKRVQKAEGPDGGGGA